MFANPIERTLVAMRREDLTDKQWALLVPLLPPHKPKTGRPNKDHRRIVNDLLWITRTGAPWHDDLPERFGARLGDALREAGRELPSDANDSGAQSCDYGLQTEPSVTLGELMQERSRLLLGKVSATK